MTGLTYKASPKYCNREKRLSTLIPPTPINKQQFTTLVLLRERNRHKFTVQTAAYKLLTILLTKTILENLNH